MESEFVEFTVSVNTSENLRESLSEGKISVHGCDRGDVYSFIATQLFGANSEANKSSFLALRKEYHEREKILDEIYDRESMISWIQPHKISCDNSRTYRIAKNGAPFKIINNGRK